jgi:hypothetical protein
MENLICTECATTYYSAAAAAMVGRGERCDCGGVLRVVDLAEVPVGGPAEPAPATAPKTTPPYGTGRRFARD